MNTPDQTTCLTLKKTIEFEMAHILANAESRACNATIHGHSYKMVLAILGTINPLNGMVVDFKRLAYACRMIHNLLDHSLWVATEEQFTAAKNMGNDKVIFMQGFNPSAENMVFIIMKTIVRMCIEGEPLWPANVKFIGIELSETSTSSAAVCLPMEAVKQLRHPMLEFSL